MIKLEGAVVPLFWPGGSSAGTGVFHETGEFPNDYAKFFNRYNGGKWLILPNSAIGGSLGVRAQVGGGEGHVEVTLSPLLLRAAQDPSNPWGITPSDVTNQAINLTLMDFQALYGKEGLLIAQERYGTATSPQQPDPSAELRRQLAAALTDLETARFDHGRALATLERIQARASGVLANLPKTGGGNPARIGREFATWVLEQ